MLVYVFTSGTHGDVFPFLGIGRALRDLGHEVVVFTHPYFARDVERAELGMHPMGGDMDIEALLKSPDAFHSTRGHRVVVQMSFRAIPATTTEMLHAIEERRPDVIVTHHFMFGPRWIAEGLDIPCAVCCLSPMAWFSRRDPVPAFQRRSGWLRKRAATITMRAARPVVIPILDRRLNRARRRVGLARQRKVFLNDFRGGTVNLGMWSRHFRGPLKTDPASGVICGFPFYDGRRSNEGLSPEVEAFLNEGEPPIVFTLGSAAFHTAGSFYDMAAEACASIGRRGLLLTGRSEYAPKNLPAGVRAFASAPHSLLLPRAACTVHHAGIGSASQALRSGRPSVVIPFAHDQFNNATRLESIGVARSVRRARLSPARLSEALEEVLGVRQIVERAASLGDLIRQENGSQNAAEECVRIASGA